MKKFILLLLVLLFPLCMLGQNIQTKFFGLTIGKQYSPEEVKAALMKVSNTKKCWVSGQTITSEAISFAGHIWSSVSFRLSEDNKLCFVDFTEKYTDNSKALFHFIDLSDLLQSKYGEGKQWKEYKRSYCRWVQTNGMQIDLQLADLNRDDDNKQKRWETILQRLHLLDKQNDVILPLYWVSITYANYGLLYKVNQPNQSIIDEI